MKTRARRELAFPALVALALGACAGVELGAQAPVAAAADAGEPSPAARVRRDAALLAPLVTTKLAREFLSATSALPDEAPRHVGARTIDYYETKYGSPLAYVRAVELLAADGLDDVAGKKIVDFGYGGIGHLRLLASLGANVTGIDVDPLLPLLYSAPGDTGAIASAQGRGGVGGTVTLLDGRFPLDPKIRDAVGAGADVFLSKNTLKRGYIHPARPVSDKQRIDLGMSDDQFLAAIVAAVRPGGRVLVFNICPGQAPPDKPYIPWADGQSPFDRAAWERAGFAVVYIDRDETEAVKTMARRLGWDRGEDAMDLDGGLFAWATLARRR